MDQTKMPHSIFFLGTIIFTQFIFLALTALKYGHVAFIIKAHYQRQICKYNFFFFYFLCSFNFIRLYCLQIFPFFLVLPFSQQMEQVERAELQLLLPNTTPCVIQLVLERLHVVLNDAGCAEPGFAVYLYGT